MDLTSSYVSSSLIGIKETWPPICAILNFYGGKSIYWMKNKSSELAVLTDGKNLIPELVLICVRGILKISPLKYLYISRSVMIFNIWLKNKET